MHVTGQECVPTGITVPSSGLQKPQDSQLLPHSYLCQRVQLSLVHTHPHEPVRQRGPEGGRGRDQLQELIQHQQ